MGLTFEYWFMLPVAILFATTAMASGVEGATFFDPDIHPRTRPSRGNRYRYGAHH